MEPPIIKPPDSSNFDDADVVPGEEEILLPLNPPIISAPDSTEDLPIQSQSEDQILGFYLFRQIIIN